MRRTRPDPSQAPEHQAPEVWLGDFTGDGVGAPDGVAGDDGVAVGDGVMADGDGVAWSDCDGEGAVASDGVAVPGGGLSVEGLLEAAVVAGPGVVGLELLMQVRGQQCSAGELLRVGGLLARVGNWVMGLEAEVAARAVEQVQVEGLAGGVEAERLVAQEYALRTARTYPAWRDRVGVLAGQWGAMAAALGQGDREGEQARVIVRAGEQVAVPAEYAVEDGKVVVAEDGEVIDGAQRARWQGAIITHGQELCARFPARKVARELEKFTADLARQAHLDMHQREYKRRHVRMSYRPGSMAELGVYGSAVEITRVFKALTDMAGRPSVGDPRPVDQRRYDELVSLFTDPMTPGQVAGLCSKIALARQQPRVLIAVPAQTLLTGDGAPAQILGGPPVPAEVARVIAKDATWQAMLTDPRTGRLIALGETIHPPGVVLPGDRPGLVSRRVPTGVLSLKSPMPGRGFPPAADPNGDPDATGASTDPATWPSETLACGTYAPSVRIKRMLAVRDQTCIIPTCSQPAFRCEIDHVVEFDPAQPAAEQTVMSNLSLLCKGHHQLKTAGHWDTTREPITGETTLSTGLGHTVTLPPTTPAPVTPSLPEPIPRE
jgi:hypothetical protein